MIRKESERRAEAGGAERCARVHMPSGAWSEGLQRPAGRNLLTWHWSRRRYPEVAWEGGNLDQGWRRRALTHRSDGALAQELGYTWSTPALGRPWIAGGEALESNPGSNGKPLNVSEQEPCDNTNIELRTIGRPVLEMPYYIFSASNLLCGHLIT